jgi:hypothetical protein
MAGSDIVWAVSSTCGGGGGGGGGGMMVCTAVPEKLPTMKAALAAYRKAVKELERATKARDTLSKQMPALQSKVSAAMSVKDKAGNLLLKVAGK